MNSSTTRHSFCRLALYSLFLLAWVFLLGACDGCDDPRYLGDRGDETEDAKGADGSGGEEQDGSGENNHTPHPNRPEDCGNGVCDGHKDSANCPEDCPESPTCGNGICSPDDGDDCRTCPGDCGTCEDICGDGVCWGTENCVTCEKDCGACLSEEDGCGDGVCDEHETQYNCPHDCGFPTPQCGDNVCNGDENCETCPHDCGECSATCEPGQCLPGENCRNCPSGCGPCTGCGDGACYSPESCLDCPQDCGTCLGEEDGCGDGICGPGENSQNCPQDCGKPVPVCGDGICNGLEDSQSCPEDCPPAPSETCPDGQCYMETCQDCPQDCGTCKAHCGDGICQPGETACACETDCGPCNIGDNVCGDGVCDLGETQDTCPADCDDSTPGCLVDQGMPECEPSKACTGEDDLSKGAVCDGIKDAWKATADNVGYYPYKARNDMGEVEVIAGLGAGLGDPEMLLTTLEPGDIFAVQSTRNPNCMDNPPLRTYKSGTGLVFGYVPDKNIYGWIDPSQLSFAGYEMEDEACTDGPNIKKYPNFQVRHNPYDNCREMPCNTAEQLPDGSFNPRYNSCSAANSVEQDRSDCGGARVEETDIRDVKVITPLHYSQLGTAHSFIYPGDKVKVLYIAKAAGWGFVEVTETSGAPLTNKGDRGWALLNRMCPEGEDDCTICVDNDMDGYGEGCPAGDDCDDNDPTVYEGAPELCDGKDNDCNGLIDDSPLCEATCVDDRHEPDDSSRTGNPLKSAGSYNDMISCADCPSYNADWFILGYPNQPLEISLTQPTGTNANGLPYGTLNVEFYCGQYYCDAIRGDGETISGVLDGTCDPGSSRINKCGPADIWTLMVYTRCGAGPDSGQGTPYVLERHN